MHKIVLIVAIISILVLYSIILYNLFKQFKDK